MLKRFPIILFFSVSIFSFNAFADEQTELQQAIRQLESAKQALIRAQQQAKNTKAQARFYFDYLKAQKEIDIVISGIHYYLNNDRAQPRDPRQLRTLSGDYEKMKAPK